MIQQLDRYRTPPSWLPGSAWPGNLAPITIGPDAWIAARAIVRGNPAVVVGHR